MVSIIHFITFALRFADVAKLVDALDLGSSAVRHGGSSPSIRTGTLLCISCHERVFLIHY